MKQLISILVLLGLSYLHSFAQLNIKVAAQGEYANFSVIHSIFSTYNNKNSSTSFSGLKNLHVLYSLDLGLRYKMESTELEAGYILSTNSRRATFIQPDNSKLYFKVNPRADNYYLGLNFCLTKKFGLGVAGCYTNFRYLYQKPGDKLSSSTTHQGIWGSTVSLFLQIPSDGFLSVRLKPYFYFPLQNTSTQELHSILGLGGQEQLQRSWTTGIAIILYNGRQ